MDIQFSFRFELTTLQGQILNPEGEEKNNRMLDRLKNNLALSKKRRLEVETTHVDNVSILPDFLKGAKNP